MNSQTTGNEVEVKGKNRRIKGWHNFLAGIAIQWIMVGYAYHYTSLYCPNNCSLVSGGDFLLLLGSLLILVASLCLNAALHDDGDYYKGKKRWESYLAALVADFFAVFMVGVFFVLVQFPLW